jgi:hypothetical protein
MGGLFSSQQTSTKADAEIRAELDSHLQIHIDENVGAGMSHEEARRKALIQLGGFEQTAQAVRERSTLPWLETLGQDLRFALRQLRKSPGFALATIALLASASAPPPPSSASSMLCC